MFSCKSKCILLSSSVSLNVIQVLLIFKIRSQNVNLFTENFMPTNMLKKAIRNSTKIAATEIFKNGIGIPQSLIFGL